jgi:hypothetical protein
MHKIEDLLRERIASNGTVAVEIPFFGRVHMSCSQISNFSSILMRAVAELELSLVDVVLDEHDCHKARCRFLVSCSKSEALFGLLPSGVWVSKVVTLSITYGDDLRPKEWIFHERATQIEPSLLSSVDSIVEEEIADDRSDDNKALLETAVPKRSTPMKFLEHASGECRPCSFFAFRADGCRWGDDCDFCHLCDASSIRKSKRERRKAIKVNHGIAH